MSERARVLVVDDEVGPRESLRMILKPRYDIATAESGDEALKDRKSTRLNSSHIQKSRMPSSA